MFNDIFMRTKISHTTKTNQRIKHSSCIIMYQKIKVYFTKIQPQIKDFN